MRTRLPSIALGLVFVSTLLMRSAWGQDSFQVNLNQDGETIAEMRPVFLRFSAQAMPAISPREVARRYQRLFDHSAEPEVRIDALNRLVNLQAQADVELGYSPEQEQRVYREALESYDEILERGAFQGRLDELLYQMAKAHAYAGHGDQSRDRLKQLVGLYPGSPLVAEAGFRVAESAFAAGNYREAEVMYQGVLSATPSGAVQGLRAKARYMLGWSQYKRSSYRQAGATFLEVLDHYRDVTDNFQQIPSAAIDLIDDAFRVLALIAMQQGGEDYLAMLISEFGERSYSDLLYDRLADLYVARQRPLRSVTVMKAFLERMPEHPSVPAVRAQLVDVLASNGHDQAARTARAEYVAAYAPPVSFERLTAEDRERWRDYSRQLADYHYHHASAVSEQASRGPEFAKAAGYYSGLSARLQDDPGPVLRLAGDAWLQANQYQAALDHYHQAAYQTPNYPEAADAAWAALSLQARALDGELMLDGGVADYAHAAERYIARFPHDHRGSGLLSDLTNRMLTARNYSAVDRYGQEALGHAAVTLEERYSSWLALAQAFAETGQHPPSENAWRKALALALAKPALLSEEQGLEQIRHQLGTSIYRQAEQADALGHTDIAVAHYLRIEAVAAGSELAIRARFDAANCLLKGERWQPAVNELKRFRSDFANHPLGDRIGTKLVYAYQASGQLRRAAEELLNIAEQADDGWAFRHQAAELFHEAGDTADRNQLYQSYLDLGVSVMDGAEHLRQQRMRQRLSESSMQPGRLREALVRNELASEWHTDDSLTWAANAALALGIAAGERFAGIELTHPLPDSLSRKQHALDEARSYFQKAGRLGGESLRSETRYRHAELYRLLASHLMNSSRPNGLTELESSQYEMLLEEQAYPFEEMAIELYAQNHLLLQDGHYDDWIERSMAMLAELFPGRYARQVRWMTWQPEGVNNG
ncbi:tetratricopeptide repeat protein [Marinobacter sp. SS21]|uniref:tetratricopeptide repeat protein n=1 Tax=Marinobacter sp. SS21 TaxID=2979460 RepID=UPI00232A7C9B|nr:tetratricopeptide repeat protein [Marinobacter sp. SS21]MDC0661915.1 hypothetical protein [Marinobacter sp. SS21]